MYICIHSENNLSFYVLSQKKSPVPIAYWFTIVTGRELFSLHLFTLKLIKLKFKLIKVNFKLIKVNFKLIKVNFKLIKLNFRLIKLNFKLIKVNFKLIKLNFKLRKNILAFLRIYSFYLNNIFFNIRHILQKYYKNKYRYIYTVTACIFDTENFQAMVSSSIYVYILQRIYFYTVCVESGTSISHVAPHRYIH